MAETICAVALDAATYAIDKLYSYRVPDELREQVQIGTRVLVPFGFGNKRAEGVVLAFREDTGEYRLKPIVEALDEQPVLTQEQLNSLSEHDRLGAAVFILVSVELQDFYRVPWGVWRDMRKLYGHKHMNKAELEPFRVQYIAGVLKLLEGIELEYGEQEETL